MLTINVSANGVSTAYPVPAGTSADILLQGQDFRRIFQLGDGVEPLVNGNTGHGGTPLAGGDTVSFRTKASSKA